MGASLSIGTVAAMSGLTRDAIRYYERRGLLAAPARTPAGYRRYGEGVVRRLALIRNAQRFGFSLAAIASFLRVREAGGRPCESVRAAAQKMLEAMDVQFAELSTARMRMRRTLHQWDRALARTPSSRQARLLERLPAMPHTRARSALPARTKETS
jgi:DNA-binding transcriptional MerR regulator